MASEIAKMERALKPRQRGEKEKGKGNKAKNWTRTEDLILMAWAEEEGLGATLNGSLDLVSQRPFTEAISMLASGWFNGYRGRHCTPRTPEAIWGRWVRHRQRFKSTWEKLWNGEWDWSDEELGVVADVEEVADMEGKKAALEREIRQLQDALSSLQPFTGCHLETNLWDEDKVFDLTDEVPLSDRKAERRYGDNSLYKNKAKTTNPLPEDMAERLRFKEAHWTLTSVDQMTPEELLEAQEALRVRFPEYNWTSHLAPEEPQESQAGRYPKRRRKHQF